MTTNEATVGKSVGSRAVRADGADKVTGRAAFGADMRAPGMLHGKILRSPHAHARILAIHIAKAEAIPGVKAVVTAADLPALPDVWELNGNLLVNYSHLSQNSMARGKALYDGHAVAAVAATSARIAEQALAAIEVEYEVLPHVIEVEEASAAGAPLLHDNLFTKGVDPVPEAPSNVASRMEMGLGDIEAGFAQADEIVEREFVTKPVHQGYIEPQAALASATPDGQCRLWCSTQAQFYARSLSARINGMDHAQLRVTPTEVGGGFGGKIVAAIEPVAVALSRKAARPVRLVITRAEVFRAMGPASGSAVRVRMGATREGRITAAELEVKLQAGAFPGAFVSSAVGRAFGAYFIENVKSVGYDVVCNIPKIFPYRAPGAPNTIFGVEAVIDELAQRLGMDAIALRLRNAARDGMSTVTGPVFGTIGAEDTLAAAKAHPHWSAPLGPGQGRGAGYAFWFNSGGESSASVNINEDGTAVLVSGSPDLSGTRHTLSMMAADTLGIDVRKITAVMGDTNEIGYTYATGGSRVTFATGIAAVEATRDVVRELCARAARIWEIPEEAVEWADGHARPAGANAGEFEPLSLAEIARTANTTGGPIAVAKSVNAPHFVGPTFGVHICDVAVDRETGRVTVLRYTVVQEVGRAMHPGYVEGQMQGGAAQGIGWALNEALYHGPGGRLENPGFLDYRIPVASDLPMIDTVIVEVPNAHHPFGARGVGETAIVPPVAAVANAVSNAIGIRLTELPLTPARVLAAILRGGGESG